MAGPGRSSTPATRGAPAAGLLSASGNYADSVTTLGLIALGIALLMVWVWMAVTSGSTGAPSWAPGDERYVALGVNAVLTLLLVRWVVGARVTRWRRSCWWCWWRSWGSGAAER